MAMNVAPSGSGDGEEIPMSDINTTPLVDVMLVLLIIFLIAVPVVIQTVDVNLPSVRLLPTTTKPENVALSIRAADNGACEVYWNLTPVNSTELLNRAISHIEDEVERFGGVDNMTEDDLPEVHIRGDVSTPWRCIGGPIYIMQQAGFSRVGFISEPTPGQGIQRL
ncbi:ExbD/TolR family protein [Parasphingopyxis marina]|uniref:Biopolymer transporter ExbD n=1 Tax=Parasphingopyxis marina TaxID=2761622 RepID=A0A842HZX9_9SPHN|nr:biopolymer transporter ExbD [Parasphingopyxis marina]MBC2778435.1 biopolymer transporter ExbD [Parasphingopyxis marina]